MNFNKFLLIPVSLLTSAVLVYAWPCLAGDLDDGVSKYTDDSIETDDEMGKPDKNIKYIIQKAKSQAAMGEKKGDDAATSGTSSASGSMNSVILGPGSNIKGDVIILDQSKGDKTQVVE